MLEGGVPGELKPPLFARHWASHTSDAVEPAFVQGIHEYLFRQDVIPHLIVFPVHNGIRHQFAPYFAGFHDFAGFIVVVGQNQLVLLFGGEMLEDPAAGLPLVALTLAS